MKIFLTIVLVMLFCLTAAGCSIADYEKPEYRVSACAEEIVLKFSEKFEEDHHGNDKFYEKWTEKSEKDYTWVIYKLLRNVDSTEELDREEE